MNDDVREDQLISEEDVSVEGENPEVAVNAEAPEEAFEQETEPTAQQQEDWRLQAMQDPRVRERFDAALFGGNEQAAAQAQQQQRNPVVEAQQRLQELNNSMPQLDENNMTAEQVTAFLQWQNERAAAQQHLYDAQLAATQYEVQAQRARATLEDYIGRVKNNDPDFARYEKEFRDYVRDNNIDPNLLENRQIVEMIRKSIGYDHVRGRRKAKAPGAPPVDESYNSQGRKARQQREEADRLREATEFDHQLAAYYRMPVEELIRGEDKYQGDSERWSMNGAVQWSDDEKLRRAGIRR